MAEISHHVRGKRDTNEDNPLDKIHTNNEHAQHRGTKRVVTRLAKSSKSTKAAAPFPECVKDNYVSTYVTVGIDSFYSNNSRVDSYLLFDRLLTDG